MPATVVLLSALGTGLVALLLRRWPRTLARTTSGWLRPWILVLLALLGGVGAATLARSYPELVAYAILAVACALLVVIDLAAYRLPDIIVGPMYPILFTALAVAAALSGDWSRLGRAAISAGIFVLCYFILAFITPDNLGLGDVKLAGLLGAFLGWLGWSAALRGTLAAFVLSGVFALVLVLGAGATRRTAFAFGPWMVAGAAVGAAWTTVAAGVL